MAISKVLQYNSTPTTVADYQAQNAHLQAMINKANGSMGILKQASIATIPSISQGGYISMGGTLYVVDTSDYTILGSLASGLNYIRLGVSGDNLVATWVQNISSYTWNSVYNYYTDGTNALLPYVVNYATNYYIGRFNQTVNQQLKTDSNVTFASVNSPLKVQNGNEINLVNGYSKLDGLAYINYNGATQPVTDYRLCDGKNAGVLANLKLKDLGVDGDLLPTTTPTSGSQVLAGGATWTPPRGVYVWTTSSSVSFDFSINGGLAFYDIPQTGTIFADGLKVMFKNTDTVSHTINYLKF